MSEFILDKTMREPLAGSSKTYIDGKGVSVPFRAVKQSSSKTPAGATEINPDLLIYDTSGPYTDQKANIDIQKGLRSVRSDWILNRDDTVELKGPSS